MRAMIFSGPGRLLRETQVARLEPGPGQVTRAQTAVLSPEQSHGLL